MSNHKYFACSECEFLLSEDEDGVMECPHFHKRHGIINVGDAEDYRDMDDEGYNKGFPEGMKHSCKNCNYGKDDLNDSDN